jgi:hypothetical protein
MNGFFITYTDQYFLFIFFRWTPWKPKFEVHDAQNTPLFHILGECCFCCPCKDIIFKVRHQDFYVNLAMGKLKMEFTFLQSKQLVLQVLS